MSNNNEVRAITITCLYEFHPDNYDEGEGNVKILKKIRRSIGTFTFRSRYKNRYNLFLTLKDGFGWEEAPACLSGSGDNKVIQFDLRKANIITHAELDAFGYMFTEESTTLTRKAPVGITRAEALEPYYADYAFYANHDLVRRARGQGETANPNLSNQEEAKSIYKLTVTIDCTRLGKDEWILEPVDDYEVFIYVLTIIKDNLKDTDFIERIKEFIKKMFSSNGTNFDWKQYNEDREKKVNIQMYNEISNKGLSIENALGILEKVLHDLKVIKKKKSENRNEAERSVWSNANRIRNFDELLKPLEDLSYKHDKGIITTYAIKERGQCKLKITFKICSEEKKKRIRDIITAVINGLLDNKTPLNPIFVVGAGLKVPMPLFHSHINIVYVGSNRFEVVGIEDAINDYVVGNLFIKETNRVCTLRNERYIYDKEEFINNLLDACCSAGREGDPCQDRTNETSGAQDEEQQPGRS